MKVKIKIQTQNLNIYQYQNKFRGSGGFTETDQRRDVEDLKLKG